MASTRLIKRRIKSAGNIAQITRAMEMVAASKMKKAQNLAITGKPYAQKIYQAVFELAKRVDVSAHPLLKKNIESNKSLIVMISTNKGLCGGLNTNMFRAVHKWFGENKNVDFISIGKKGEGYIIRTHHNLIASFGQSGQFVESIPAVIELVVKEYLEEKYREVDLVFNDFITALRQEPTRKKILPLGIEFEENKNEEEYFAEFLIEPRHDLLLDSLIPHYLESQLRAAVLESQASEYSAQMIAMKNATDNAIDLTNELTLEYNKARQEKITYEISDMVTASLAVQ